MNSQETLNLNAQTVAKPPATKHVSKAHSTPISVPVGWLGADTGIT